MELALVENLQRDDLNVLEEAEGYQVLAERFNLTQEQIGEIVKIQIEHLDTRLAERNIDLVLAEGALSLIVENGYDPIYGARPLKRVIQKYIENPLSMEILKGNIMDGDRISAEVDGDHIIFKTL